MPIRTLIISIALAVSSYSMAYDIKGKIIKVADGDSVTLLDASHKKHKIRLYGIDAPEKGQPFGNKSKRMLSKLVFKKYVIAKCRQRDRYKRHICTLFLNKQDINLKMVKNGGAWIYRKYYKEKSYYPHEKTAKKQKLGLWKTSEAKITPPWEWRKKGVTSSYISTDTSVPVKLSRNKICHARGTKYYKRTKRFTRYETLKECLKYGRLPKR